MNIKSLLKCQRMQDSFNHMIIDKEDCQTSSKI